MTDYLDLWQINLNPSNITSESCLSILSNDEQKKAHEFIFQIHQRRYVIGRYCLRVILSYYLNIHPIYIEFIYNKYGKPLLKNRELEFNLSHSNDRAILAINKQSPVGVDIEHTNLEQDFQSLAQEILSEYEYQQFVSLNNSLQKIAFYRAWTCKEAFTKCLGLGFSFDVKCCQVHLIPSEKIKLLSINYPGLNSKNYRIYDIKTHISDYVAVAVNEGEQKQPRYFNFSFNQNEDINFWHI